MPTWRRSFIIPSGIMHHRDERLEWCHAHNLWGILQLRLTVPVAGPGPVLIQAETNCQSRADLEDLKLNRGPYARRQQDWPRYRFRVELDEIPDWAEGF